MELFETEQNGAASSSYYDSAAFGKAIEIAADARRSRMFPNEERALRLTSELAVGRNEQWGDKKYRFSEAKTRAIQCTSLTKKV